MALVIVAGMSVMYCWSFFQRVAVPGTLFESIQGELGWSASAITGLASIYLYIYAPGQIVTGLLADRYGSARPMIIGGLVLSVGAVGFPLAHSFAAIYAFRALVGVGAAVMYLCALRELATLFDDRGFARLLGPVMFMGGLGGMLGTAPTAWATQQIGWRGALLVAGVLTAVSALVLTVLLLRTRVAGHVPSPISPAAVGRAIINPRLRPLIPVGSITFVSYFLFQAVVGQKFLQDVARCTPVRAAGITFAMQLTSMAMMLLSGSLSAAFGHRRRPAVITMTLLVLGGTSVLSVASLTGGGLGLCVTGFIALGLANGLIPLYCCACKEVTHPAVVAFILSLLNALTYISVAVASNAAGLVLDAFSDTAVTTGDVVHYPPAAYASMLGVLVLLAVLSLISATRIREPGCLTAGTAATEAEGGDAGDRAAAG